MDIVALLYELHDMRIKAFYVIAIAYSTGDIYIQLKRDIDQTSPPQPPKPAKTLPSATIRPFSSVRDSGYKPKQDSHPRSRLLRLLYRALSTQD